MVNSNNFQVFGLEWDIFGPFALFQLHHTEIQPADVSLAHDIINFYTDGLGAGDLSPQNLQNMTNMLSDSFFWFSVELFLDKHLPQTQGNTFQYLFKYWVRLLSN